MIWYAFISSHSLLVNGIKCTGNWGRSGRRGRRGCKPGKLLDGPA